MRDKFIITQDRPTAEELVKQGFVKVGDDGKNFLFINSGNMIFSDKIKEKIAYTNIMSF